MIFAVGALSSCRKTDLQLDTDSANPTVQGGEDIKFIASLGYDVADIEKTGDGYLVEGDIWLTGEWLADARKQPQTRLTQHNQGTLVKKDFWDKLFLDPNSVASSLPFWYNPVADAMYQWNNLNRTSCKIEISNTSSAGFQQIAIKFEGKSSFGNSTDKLMKVTPPSFDGKPGSVTINQDCSFLPQIDAISDNATKNKAIYTIMHAIGHTLGLGHTPGYDPSGTYDEDWGGQIDKTMDLDNKSIMRREANPLPWSGFSAQDKTDIPKVFPKEETPQPQAFTPGSIEKSRIINLSGGTFSVSSVSDASGGTGTISYAWEKKSGSGWIALTGQTGKNLTNAPVPAELTTEYRRKASAGKETGYSNICTVTNNAYKPMEPGKIEESVLVDTADSGAALTITSTEAAACLRDEVSYSWEMKLTDSWRVIPGATGESLTTTVPMQFSTVYRRKASCNHSSAKYSNECTVLNTAFLDAGTLPDLLEINKTEIYHVVVITPTGGTQIPGATYEWEISRDGHPIAFESYYAPDDESFSWSGPTGGRTTLFRRRLTFGNKSVLSNECTVIDHAFQEDPLKGTGFDNMIDLGTYGSDFIVTQTIDTRGEYFWDQDQTTQGGNDAFMTLELTRRMTVHITTGASICFVCLEIMNDEGVSYFDISSTPFSAKWGFENYYPFALLDDKNPGAEPVTLEMLPGKYQIVIQGSEAYNGRYKNHVLGIRLRGVAFLEPIPIP